MARTTGSRSVNDIRVKIKPILVRTKKNTTYSGDNSNETMWDVKKSWALKC
jgi:hypothetical protein